MVLTILTIGGCLSNKLVSANTLARDKRSFDSLPWDARKIIVHNMRGFNVYGSSDGAYKEWQGNGRIEKIPGISGNVIGGIVSDKFYRGWYNIYLEVENGSTYSQYTIRDYENQAHMIGGLPNDARLRCMHNLAGFMFYGSSNGAYELDQGSLNAVKVSIIPNKFIESIDATGPNKYDIRWVARDVITTTTTTTTQRPTTTTSQRPRTTTEFPSPRNNCLTEMNLSNNRFAPYTAADVDITIDYYAESVEYSPNKKFHKIKGKFQAVIPRKSQSLVGYYYFKP